MSTVLGFNPTYQPMWRPNQVPNVRRPGNNYVPQVQYYPQGGPGDGGTDTTPPVEEGPGRDPTPLPPPAPPVIDVDPSIARSGAGQAPPVTSTQATTTPVPNVTTPGAGGSSGNPPGIQGPGLNPPGSQYIFDGAGNIVSVRIPPNPGSYVPDTTIKVMTPQEIANIVAQTTKLQSEGRLVEAQILMAQSGISGFYTDPTTGKTMPTFTREQWAAQNSGYTTDPVTGKQTPTFTREQWQAQTGGYYTDPVTGKQVPTMPREQMGLDDMYRWGIARGFTPSGDPTLDRERLTQQVAMENAANTRADAQQRVSEGDLRLRADLGYADSRRNDLVTNLNRQNQGFNQNEVLRSGYRNDQTLGMQRQNQAFNQQMQQRQQTIDLARNPQDYLSYAFMSAGKAPPPGVGITDALARAGKPIPDVDTYLGGQGLGSVRSSYKDVPDVETFLNGQAGYK